MMMPYETFSLFALGLLLGTRLALDVAHLAAISSHGTCCQFSSHKPSRESYRLRSARLC
jgi:hypothetical protein